MSAFKTLLASDIIVTPVTYNKSFTFPNNASITGSGIDFKKGLNEEESSSEGLNSNDLISPYSIYNSVKQLYYTNFLISSSGDPAVVTQDINGVLLNLRNGVTASTLNQPNFENYLQTTLTQSRYFPNSANGGDTNIAVILIPNNLYGDYIVPNTFSVLFNDGGEVLIYDDGEGNLYLTSTNNGISQRLCGNIIYPHGICIITINPGLSAYDLLPALYSTTVEKSISFQSSYTIYETQIKCNIKSSEFTTTLNPSLISGSKGQVYDYATGSFFSPYITTIGLYNDNQDLLMVAKLAQPLQTSPTTDTNILINIDR
jgi:hypothetical protein